LGRRGLAFIEAGQDRIQIARDIRRSAGLGHGEGQQGQDGDSPRQRLGDVAHQGEALGAREKPLSRPPVRIDPRLDVAQQLRRVLDLIEDHRRTVVVEKAMGIGQRPGAHVWILEGHKAMARPVLHPQQRGLPGLAGARHQDRREQLLGRLSGHLQIERIAPERQVRTPITVRATPQQEGGAKA